MRERDTKTFIFFYVMNWLVVDGIENTQSASRRISHGEDVQSGSRFMCTGERQSRVCKALILCLPLILKFYLS